MNLQLRKFKPEAMTDDRVCVFVGKRNTGKSITYCIVSMKKIFQ